MKRFLLLALTAGLLSPAQAEVDPSVHKMCLQAKDYLGCVKAQKTKTGVELWEGIHTGMSVKELKNKLGGDITCKKKAYFNWEKLDMYCQRLNPKISIGESSFIINVRFKGDVNNPSKQEMQDLTLVSNDHFYCPDRNYENCEKSSYQYDRDQKRLKTIRDNFDRKYGKYRLNKWEAPYWYGEDKMIELGYDSPGLFWIKYMVDDALRL